MVKALHFKGDKKPKKRKRAPSVSNVDEKYPDDKNLALTTATTASKASDTADDDSWVSADIPTDISGPILIVLPTEPATCIACDANGKVFTSALENFVVEDDPATAEPHDVRQVWVANRVAGTEEVSLKGHHGRYLGCDKYGILSANSTAISPEESFLCIPVPDNPSTFSLQTQREKFLTIDDSKTTPDVRGDAESITFNTTFRIRMQARFKPKLKASKEEKAHAKISRKELEDLIGRRLEDTEVRKLKKARREGDFHEVALDMKVKSSHDKFAS